MEQKIFITIKGKKVSAILENNLSAKALVEKLKLGNITYNAQDYGGIEKVGDIGFSLLTADSYLTSTYVQ